LRKNYFSGKQVVIITKNNDAKPDGRLANVFWFPPAKLISGGIVRLT